MKKLIISAITAAALLFGFAGCSGDLHDDEKRIIDLSAGGAPGDFDEPANWSEKEPWTTSDVKTGTYTLSFKTKDEIPADGVGFKINSQLAWNVDGYTEFTVAADGAAATAKLKAGSAMAGAGNAFITGCKPSTAYKMTVVCNPDTTVTVKVEVDSAAPSAPAESAPVPYYLDGYAVRSLDSGWNVTGDNLLYNPTEDKATGNLTYNLDFIASASTQQLAIARKEWSEGRWECSEAKSFAVGAEPIFLESGKEQHPTVTGLTVGNPYRIYVYTTPEKKVSMKVDEIAKVTLSFKVKGLTEGDSAWINGSFWGSTWPQGWPIKGWNKETDKDNVGATDKYISAHPAAVADASGVAAFDSKWNTEFVSKVGDTKSWECKVVYINKGKTWDGEDTVKDSGANLKFDYKVTAGGSYTIVIDAANGWKISVE